MSDGRNKYSVPYNLIGEKVDICVTKTAVEVFYQGSRVACRRFKKVRYVRLPEFLDELSIARNGGELKKCLAS